MVSAPTEACAASSAPFGGPSSASNSESPALHRMAHTTPPRRLGTDAPPGGRNRSTSSAKTSPGLMASKIFVSVVLPREQ